MGEYKVLTPEQYARHLKKNCGLKDFEVDIVLRNVYKRLDKEEEIKNKKK